MESTLLLFLEMLVCALVLSGVVWVYVKDLAHLARTRKIPISENVQSAIVFPLILTGLCMGIFFASWVHYFGHPMYLFAEVGFWLMLVGFSAAQGWKPPKKKKKWG